MSNSYVKIGISSDAVKRINRLNEVSKDEKFSLVKVIFTRSVFESRLIESQLHSRYSEYNIPTKITGAKTECFNKEILEDVLRFSAKNASYCYDPFIFVSKEDAEVILGMTFRSVYEKFNVKASKPIVCELLQNIAANIYKSEGRSMFYNSVILREMSPSMTWGIKLFEHFAPKFSNVVCDYVDIKIKYFDTKNPPKRLTRYAKVTRGYLFSIESLQENSGLNKKTNYFKKLNEYIGLDYP